MRKKSIYHTSDNNHALNATVNLLGFKLRITLGNMIRRSVNYFILFLGVNFKVEIYQRRNTEHY
jgi:hypothetical protein